MKLRKIPKRNLDFRVRHEPPTLDEAIFAAQGLNDNVNEQVEIAAALMGLPEDHVRQAVLGQARHTGPKHRTLMMGRFGAQRSVIVERRPARRSALEPLS
jgi:hypothetical protein